MSARFPFIFALVLGSLWCGAAAADTGEPPFAPPKYDISRYEKIWKAEPFIKETVVVQNNVGLAARYALVGLVESGENSVAFIDDSGKTVMLTKKRPDPERNLELVAIMADKNFRNSRVRIRQGGEEAELKFDPRGLVAMGGSAAPDAGVPNSAVPPPPNLTPGAIVPPPAATGASTGAPGAPARRIISPGTPIVPSNGSGGVIPPPPANAAAGQAPPAATRRIIRPKPIDATN